MLCTLTQELNQVLVFAAFEPDVLPVAPGLKSPLVHFGPLVLISLVELNEKELARSRHLRRIEAKVPLHDFHDILKGPPFIHV